MVNLDTIADYAKQIINLEEAKDVNDQTESELTAYRILFYLAENGNHKAQTILTEYDLTWYTEETDTIGNLRYVEKA